MELKGPYSRQLKRVEREREREIETEFNLKFVIRMLKFEVITVYKCT